ncbi:hypothetical protein [Paludibacterium denitrificans]|uniref:hypothetical protein n=1 Tax=Paludibacterium denitrificans TaxID=2675226 RepID=UPI001E40ACCE|nr:hypothetical protein [Paludibacterium denitrificans]
MKWSRYKKPDGRVLAADVIAPLAVPGFDNSAMDGYALNGIGFKRGDACAASCGAHCRGGCPPLRPLDAGCAFTGSADTGGLQCGGDAGKFAMLKAIPLHVDKLALLRRAVYRRMGEDIAKDAVVPPRGERLNPAALALLASMGLQKSVVYTPRKWLCSIPATSWPEPGQPAARSDLQQQSLRPDWLLLRRLGCELTVAGLVADDFAATRDQLAHLRNLHDVVDDSPVGVSVGEGRSRGKAAVASTWVNGTRLEDRH